MLFRHRSRNINNRQQHEDIRLQNRNDDMQSAEDDWNANRDHGKENQGDQIAGENIGPQTHGERKQARKMADQFDRQHQNRHQDARDQRHPFHWRSKKMQQIFRPGVLESLRVVVQEGTDRAAQRHHRNASRGLESGDQTDQVTDQDKDENNGEESDIRFGVMPDDFFALAHNEALKRLESVLERAGRVHRQTRAHDQENRQQEEENQQFH